MMTGREKIKRAFRIRAERPRDAADGYHVYYTARGLQQIRGNGSFPRVPPDFQALVPNTREAPSVQWVNAPKDLEATVEDFEQDAAERVRLLHEWLDRLFTLLQLAETWVKELGWATRQVEKSMQDSHIGDYQAPGLLMQEGVDRILLEPIGRSAPGSQGVVDLYLLPAYDDIAVHFYYDGRWNIHRNTFRGTNAVVPVSEAEAVPLSKESLHRVLAELRQHAA